jgi:hypothetical protein
MIALGMGLALICLAIYALATGRLTLVKGRVVMGPLARKLALVLLLPLPLSYLAQTVMFSFYARGGIQIEKINSVRWTIMIIDGAIVLLCLGVVYAVGWSRAVDPAAQNQKLMAATSPASASIATGASAEAPLAVCANCGKELRRAEYDRLPPWCPGCGKDLKQA